MSELNSSESFLVSDPGIPTLEKAFDPVVLGDELPDVLPPEWGTIRNVRLQVLKHHPGHRCTFEIALGTTTGFRSLIGKVYATDRADVYEAMERIWRAGFRQDQEFSIPRPQGYLPELRLLLQEKIEGTRAKEIFLKASDRDRAVTAERCARWLVRFHATAPKAGPVFEISKHLATLERRARHIAEVAQPLGEKAGRLFDRLVIAAARLSSIEMCAGHGSYSHDQVILADGLPFNGGKGHTITFDWDGYDVADPCRDVARFTVGLRRVALSRLGSIRALDTYGEVFQRTYVAARGPQGVTNLAFYQAAICLQLAAYIAGRSTPGWREKIEAMLDEGHRIFQAGPLRGVCTAASELDANPA